METSTASHLRDKIMECAKHAILKSSANLQIAHLPPHTPLSWLHLARWRRWYLDESCGYRLDSVDDVLRLEEVAGGGGTWMKVVGTALIRWMMYSGWRRWYLDESCGYRLGATVPALVGG
eukprot:1160790-Pelagomonas_calceolata.AAC.4